MTNITAVTIEGTAKVGQTLTAVTSPADATVSYKWKKCATAEGVYEDIASATTKTYVLKAEDEKSFIKVEVTGTGSFKGTVTSSVTRVVVATGVTTLPETPVYLTGNYVKEYLAACDAEVKQRVDSLSARTGITIPETDDVLKTAQVELFMSAL